MDATQYGHSAHFSSFRNLYPERFSGEQALPQSVNTGLQPFLGDGSISFIAEPDPTGKGRLKTEMNGLSDGEVKFAGEK